MGASVSTGLSGPLAAPRQGPGKRAGSSGGLTAAAVTTLVPVTNPLCPGGGRWRAHHRQIEIEGQAVERSVMTGRISAR